MNGYLGGQYFIVNDPERLERMREEADLSKPLEDILTLQDIKK